MACFYVPYLYKNVFQENIRAFFFQQAISTQFKRKGTFCHYQLWCSENGNWRRVFMSIQSQYKIH